MLCGYCSELVSECKVSVLRRSLFRLTEVIIFQCTNRQIGRHTQTNTHTHTHTHSHTQTDTHTRRHNTLQTHTTHHRHTDTQTRRHRYTHTHIHPSHSLCYDRSTTSSVASSPHSAIRCFLFQYASSSIVSLSRPVAAYVFFLAFPSLLSLPVSFLQ